LIRGRFIPVPAFIRGRFIPVPAFIRDHFNSAYRRRGSFPADHIIVPALHPFRCIIGITRLYPIFQSRVVVESAFKSKAPGDSLVSGGAATTVPYAGASLDRRPSITRRFCLNKRFGTAAALLSRAFAGFALDQCAIGLRERLNFRKLRRAESCRKFMDLRVVHITHYGK
jgi:hypothetical protein